MRSNWNSLLRALRSPGAMAQFDAETWDMVVRQAMSAGLLGRLCVLVRQEQLTDQIPEAVMRHMQAVMTLAEQQVRAVNWELVQLSKTLKSLQCPVLLLKGAAYAAAGLPPGAGRIFSDIDLLVPKRQISAAEAALMLGGWNSSHHDEYDQRYYRQWMHELPPMVHIRRQTVLDLHHSILPETARLRTRPDLFIDGARPLSHFPRFSVPAPEDLVLHSATHLFHEGEWEHGLRDLVDLAALLEAYGRTTEFWSTLTTRAAMLGLGRPLFYGLRYCQKLLNTHVPTEVMESCPDRPGLLVCMIMDALFIPAFSTAHVSCRHWFSGPATLALYARSHWLRMPMHLLLPHLIRKAWKKRTEALRKERPNPVAPDA